MALTSQFSSGYASSDSIQLIGYAGPGTMRHYSMLAGPRVTVPTRGRFSPFIEGLVGADRASTDLVSNGISVTGSEIQIAYAFGGGTQINLSKHFGLNFEGEYFGTQHTIAYTGWEPSHLQLAAGIVFRMFGRGPQIAEQHPPTVPNSNARTRPGLETTVTRSPESEAPGTTALSSIQSMTPNSNAQSSIQPQTVAKANMPVASTGQVTAPQIVIPGGQVVTPAPQVPALAATQPAAAVAVAVHASTSQPAAQTFPQASRPAVTTMAVVPQRAVEVQPQAPPISLGEYARRLREQKQQQSH
jgi:hypothetical protein